MITETAALLVLALGLDALFGEPRMLWQRIPHPAVVMGRIIAWADRRYNTENAAARSAGVTVMALLSLGALGLGPTIALLPYGEVISILLAAILIAQRSLISHVLAVRDALGLSLPEARRALSDIVGRDTAELGESEISRAAIESAAENFSDGVIAPAFWFLILGLPGVLLYKLVNTADSMIGHRTPRHEEFGFAAAKFDDILNYIPARLSGALIAAVCGKPAAGAVMREDASKHPSPNAGWPEAAMAGALDITLAGPRSYHGHLSDHPSLNAAGRAEATRSDISNAVTILWKSWAAFVFAVLLLAVLAT